jgi:cytochrome c biogenesis protein CcmG, thiol:disulfide interchange protein DsbE
VGVRRAAFPLVAAAVAAALVALLFYGLAQGGASGLDARVSRGERPLAPTSALPLLDGHGRRSLAAYRGRVVVVNVFASWCAPCRTEAPLLVSEQNAMARRGAVVVGVTYDDTAPDARAFARRYRITYPVLRDVDEHVADELGVRGVPETFVLDRRGGIAAISRGPVNRPFLVRAVRRASS